MGLGFSVAGLTFNTTDSRCCQWSPRSCVGAQGTGAFLRVPALPSASSRPCPPALHREPCSRQRVGRLLLPVCGARPAVGQEGSVPLVRPQSHRLVCWGRGGWGGGFLSVPGAAGVRSLSVGVWGWRESPIPPLGAEAFASTPAACLLLSQKPRICIHLWG